MIRSILVPTSGSDSDSAVFESTLALARPLNAHLHFLHVELTAAEAMLHAPHAEYCIGRAIRSTLHGLDIEEEVRTQSASRHVSDFCEAHAIQMQSSPGLRADVTFSYSVVVDNAAERLLSHARLHDLTVVGRAQHVDYMPPDLLETLIMRSGKPVLLVAADRPLQQLRTAVVAWSDSAEAARALGAALPLLQTAGRVCVVNIAEHPLASRGRVIVDYLAWHGIEAEFYSIRRERHTVAERLDLLAKEQTADLLVLGGFTHSPSREAWLGGVTQWFVDESHIPVLVMH